MRTVNKYYICNDIEYIGQTIYDAQNRVLCEFNPPCSNEVNKEDYDKYVGIKNRRIELDNKLATEKAASAFARKKKTDAARKAKVLKKLGISDAEFKALIGI